METFGSVAEAFKQRRGAGDFGRMFLCVDCGHYVTTPIVRFFRMNPDTLRCYEHQRSNRLGAGKVQS